MYFWYYTAALWAMHEMVLSCISGAHSMHKKLRIVLTKDVEKLKTKDEKLRMLKN